MKSQLEKEMQWWCYKNVKVNGMPEFRVNKLQGVFGNTLWGMLCSHINITRPPHQFVFNNRMCWTRWPLCGILTWSDLQRTTEFPAVDPKSCTIILKHFNGRGRAPSSKGCLSSRGSASPEEYYQILSVTWGRPHHLSLSLLAAECAPIWVTPLKAVIESFVVDTEKSRLTAVGCIQKLYFQ